MAKKLILLLLAGIFLLPGAAGAEKPGTNRHWFYDPYRQETFGYGDKLEVKITFTVKYYKAGEKVPQKIKAGSLSGIDIEFDFALKSGIRYGYSAITVDEAIEDIGDIFLVGEYFAYRTSHMTGPRTSRFLYAHDGTSDYRTPKQTAYIEFDGGGGATVYDSAGYRSYSGPKLFIRFDMREAIDHEKPDNDPVFAARLLEVLQEGGELSITVPYDTKKKPLEEYTPEELKKLKKLTITIPQQVIAEWRQITDLTGAEAVIVGKEKEKLLLVKISDLLAELKKEESVLNPPQRGAGF
ncbi:MAG: hypothetical protein LBP78_01230 [Acidaminococcales bacterium]|nr:hypothetical protein [Acidaminococcales bacterium]